MSGEHDALRARNARSPVPESCGMPAKKPPRGDITALARAFAVAPPASRPGAVPSPVPSIDPAELLLHPSITTWSQDGCVEVLLGLQAPGRPAVARRLVLLLDAFSGDGRDVVRGVLGRLEADDRLHVVRGGAQPVLAFVPPPRREWPVETRTPMIRAPLHGDLGAGVARACAEARRIFEDGWADARARALERRSPEAARRVLEALGAADPDDVPDPDVARDLSAGGEHADPAVRAALEDPAARRLLRAARPVDVVVVSDATAAGVTVGRSALLGIARGFRRAGVRLSVVRSTVEGAGDEAGLLGELAAAGGGELLDATGRDVEEQVAEAVGLAPPEPLARLATLTVIRGGMLTGVQVRGRLRWQATVAGAVVEIGDVRPGERHMLGLRLGIDEDLETEVRRRLPERALVLATFELEWLRPDGGQERAELSVTCARAGEEACASVRAWRDLPVPEERTRNEARLAGEAA